MPTRADGATKQIVSVIPAETLRRLDAWCEKHERSRSWTICKAIRVWLAAQEKEALLYRRPTEDQ